MTMRPPALLAFALLLAVPAAALDLDAVRACLVANGPARSARIALDLRSEDAAGQLTEQRARVLWRRISPEERRVVLRMDAPVSVAGSALLAIARQGELPRDPRLPAGSRPCAPRLPPRAAARLPRA